MLSAVVAQQSLLHYIYNILYIIDNKEIYIIDAWHLRPEASPRASSHHHSITHIVHTHTHTHTHTRTHTHATAKPMRREAALKHASMSIDGSFRRWVVMSVHVCIEMCGTKVGGTGLWRGVHHAVGGE